MAAVGPTADLARYVRAMVERSGLTPRELSQRIGVGKNRVADWMDGEGLEQHAKFLRLIRYCEEARIPKSGTNIPNARGGGMSKPSADEAAVTRREEGRCPDCFGLGWIAVHIVFGTRTVQCPTCNGTGQATPEEDGDE